MLPTAFKEYAGSGLASLGFSSNIWFWLEDSYTAEVSTLKPFLHTWSLSVEEQFYLFFPPLIWFGLKQKRIKISTLLIVTILASLIAAQIYSNLYPNAAFFLLPFRIWELLAGVWLAYAATKNPRQKDNWLIKSASLTGLIMIIVSVIFFDDKMQHPSIITLLPVIGTCLIIGTSYQSNIAGNFLSARPMVWVGLLSYSFYLWHVPIFVFSKLAVFPQNNTAKIGYIFLSAFLAFISWRFVERPYRNRSTLSLRTVIILLSASFIGLAAAFSYIYISNGVPQRIGLSQDIIDTFKAPTKKDYCRNFSITDGIKLCGFGDHKSKPSFMVLGDSHATIMLGFFDKIAKENNTQGLLASQAGCLPFLGVYTRYTEPERSQCATLMSAAYNYATSHRIDRVFMIARWGYYTTNWNNEFQSVSTSNDQAVLSENESRINFESALEHSISELQNAGIEVIILEQVPQQNFTAERAYTIAGQGFSQGERIVNSVDDAILYANSVSYKDHLKLQSFPRKAFSSYSDKEKAKVINFDSILCDERCRIGTATKSYYRDDDHLSSYGVQLIEPELSSLFKR